MADIVVFRVWRGTVDIVALFPGLLADTKGNCHSYERVGQHGAADYRLVISRTRPATPKEYSDLDAELRGCGYELDVRAHCDEFTRHAARWKAEARRRVK